MAADNAAASGLNLGPDGEKVVDMSYYDLLGVKSNADEVTIKKAYRKAALVNHPDRNQGDPQAAQRFQEIGEAYAVLSDSNLRAFYNKNGKEKTKDSEGGEMPDPGQMFAQLFGGAAFEDWIGEISLGKDVSKAFEMSTTEEEREQMKAEYTAGGSPGRGPSPAPTPISHEAHAFDKETPIPTTNTTQEPPTAGKAGATLSTTNVTASSSAPSTPPASGGGKAAEAALLAEQKKAALEKKRQEREKFEAYDRERTEEKRKRVEMLTNKLLERIRPFVESTRPGEEGDLESEKFAKRIKDETTDLAMESFGVELCWLIGEVYMQKASSYIKLNRKASSNLLGIPGWSNRVKEKFSMIKEGWSFLSVGMDVKGAMEDLEKRQAKGEIPEEEMKRLESDLSGKLLLVAWKGSRFELSSILRQVVDSALLKTGPEITEKVLMNRAKAILLTGAILKAVQPDESDAERRELERMVAEANAARKTKKGKK